MAEQDTEGVDQALVDWSATAEALQAEVTRRGRTLQRISRWVADMRARDWTVYPGAYGAGKASTVEDVAQLLADDPAPVAADDAVLDELAARWRADVEAGRAPLVVLPGVDERTLAARARLRRFALLLRQGAPYAAALRMEPEAFGALIADALGPDGDDR